MTNADTKKTAKPVPRDIVQPEPKPIISKNIDPHTFVTVRNGFHGRLIYKSKHTNERFVWDAFGDAQEMELRELVNAKSSCKAMFINNYFMFDDDWVVDYLGVRNYYKNSLRLENFDELFKKTPAAIKKFIAEMPEGQKQSVAYRARQLIASGEIDSRKAIAALEEALGVELIER